MVVSSFFVYLYRKKQDTDKLQQLIVQKRELLARKPSRVVLLTAMRICLMNNGCRDFLSLAPQNMNLAVC